MQQAQALSELNCVHALHKLIFNPRVVKEAAAVVWRQTSVTESLHLSCTFPQKTSTDGGWQSTQEWANVKKNQQKINEGKQQWSFAQTSLSPFSLRYQQVCGDTAQLHTDVMLPGCICNTNTEAQAENLLIMTFLLTHTWWKTERGPHFWLQRNFPLN